MKLVDLLLLLFAANCLQAMDAPKRAKKQYPIYKKTVEPFPCNECKLDGTKINVVEVKQHIIAKHTDLRPYACTYPGCEYKSDWSSSTRVHTKTNHQMVYLPSPETEETVRKALNPHLKAIGWHYSCSMCGDLFPKKIAAQNHINKAHKSRLDSVITQEKTLSPQEPSNDNQDDIELPEPQATVPAAALGVPSYLSHPEKIVTPAQEEQDYTDLLNEILDLESTAAVNEIPTATQVASVSLGALEKIATPSPTGPDFDLDDLLDRALQQESAHLESENEIEELPDSPQEKVESIGQRKRSFVEVSDCAQNKAVPSSKHLAVKVPTAAQDLENPLLMLSDVAESESTCQDCKNLQFDAEKLKKHIIKVHAKLTPYKCKEPGCAMEYGALTSLIYHLKIKHKTKAHAVLSLLEQKELNEILKPFLIKLGWKLQCGDCNGLFPTDTSRQNHLNSGHKEIVRSLSDKTKEHAPIERYQCPVCKTQCLNLEAYAAHAGMHITH